MSMEMSMDCPVCGHGGPHPIMSYALTEDNQPVYYVLHCNKCEEVWEERMKTLKGGDC